MSTLLQSLVRYADSCEDITPAYYEATSVSWRLDLAADGSPSPILIPLTHTEERGGKVSTKPGAQMATPKITRTVNVAPMLGVDGIAYVLGWSDGAMTPVKAAARHQAYLQLHRQWADDTDEKVDPVPAAVLRFLTRHVGQVRQPAEWTAKDMVCVAVAGVPAHHSVTAASFWAGQAAGAKSSGARGLCLVCGTEGDLVSSFPQMVKGSLVPGGQSSGTALISINELVYGYGLTRGLGQVPICADCANAIPASLNHLLSNRTHTRRDNRTVMIWWIEGNDDLDPFLMTDHPTLGDVTALLASVGRGRPAEPVSQQEFHSLLLSANAARLVVRRWNHVPLAHIKATIASWFRDIEIEPRYADGHRYQPLWRIAQATGSHDGATYLRTGDPGGHHPEDITERLRLCAFEGAPVGPALLAHTLGRISADGRIDDPRAAFLRLAITRTPHLKECPMPGLEPANTTPCYVLGRLLAAYEALQIAAARAYGGSTPNTTFADKLLAGAISSPRLVLSAGEKQSAAWLGKLGRSGRDRYHRRDIDTIIDLLDSDAVVPARANLQEQALFVLGYHHQRAATQRMIDEAIARRATNKLEPAQVPDDILGD
ncbi:MAG: type I-C CRISPR-associated protein Cas8c/Csd1 [Actinomycetota bacterium]|nr:type I-C CRISPR-associated protein Cas8c/Csd1 [Actinomycetota bacterium]